MKMVLLVPGFRETLDNHDYASLMRAIEAKGYRVEFVPIVWSRTTITDWTDQLKETYAKYNAKDVILAGFSFGSMTALAVAAERAPAQLWLFSLSPYFKEDVPHLQPAWLRMIGHRRRDQFAQVPFAEAAAAISCKTTLFAGDIELKRFPFFGSRFEKRARQFKNVRVIRIPNCDHDVTSKPYVDAINASV